MATKVFENIAFVGMRRAPFAGLSGFEKQQHAVPKKVDEYTGEFARRVADQDLSADLENVFQKLREAFKFKRVEIKKSTPAVGCGSITTPTFMYTIDVTLNPENPAEVVWGRSIIDIQSPEQLLSDAFAQVFDNVFDRVEFSLPDRLNLEDWIDRVEALGDERLKLSYDSDVTNCSLTIDGIKATIEVSEAQIAVIHNQFDRTRTILDSFVAARKAIESSFNQTDVRG